MKGHLVTAGSLVLTAMALAVSAADESSSPSPGHAPEPYGADYAAPGQPVPPGYTIDESGFPGPGYAPDPYGPDYPAHRHPAPPGYVYEELGYPGTDYGPERYGQDYQTHSHPIPPSYPMSGPFSYGGPPRIHLEKDQYEDGYLLRVHTQGLKAEDIEVEADRGRLRLRSEMSGQREWRSDEPYRRSSSSMSSRSSIRRSVRLPYDADASKLTTSIKEGVLEIRIPRL